eukprot:CAMPEP_0114557468 /NCGR_PEP_ID=MMETSP0114-20121206/9848_1 /TAXON_ID=31324 /ORGANISM="Goniomonas sp, Strain m" /LENGTH=439 /DNA_ID=CAMNT_0001742761 /DNA_START=14 /DNA_END=1329 /DNA_ORIENTATION=+
MGEEPGIVLPPLASTRSQSHGPTRTNVGMTNRSPSAASNKPESRLSSLRKEQVSRSLSLSPGRMSEKSSRMSTCRTDDSRRHSVDSLSLSTGRQSSRTARLKERNATHILSHCLAPLYTELEHRAKEATLSGAHIMQSLDELGLKVSATAAEDMVLDLSGGSPKHKRSSFRKFLRSVYHSLEPGELNNPSSLGELRIKADGSCEHHIVEYDGWYTHQDRFRPRGQVADLLVHNQCPQHPIYPQDIPRHKNLPSHPAGPMAIDKQSGGWYLNEQQRLQHSSITHSPDPRSPVRGTVEDHAIETCTKDKEKQRLIRANRDRVRKEIMHNYKSERAEHREKQELSRNKRLEQISERQRYIYSHGANEKIKPPEPVYQNKKEIDYAILAMSPARSVVNQARLDSAMMATSSPTMDSAKKPKRDKVALSSLSPSTNIKSPVKLT